jgi:hypothetical protein
MLTAERIAEMRKIVDDHNYEWYVADLVSDFLAHITALDEKIAALVKPVEDAETSGTIASLRRRAGYEANAGAVAADLIDGAALLTRLWRELAEARRERDEALGHIDDLDSQLEDALSAPWPKWAERILDHLKEAGFEYDDGEEIDLPGNFIDHVNEWIRGIERDAKKATDAAIARAEAAEARLAACDRLECPLRTLAQSQEGGR